MTFANPFPWWALLALIAGSAAVAWLGYSRAPIALRGRAVLSLIRFLTLLLVIGLLMRPVRRAGVDEPSDAVVPILVDASRSMSIEDADGLRRIDRARDIVKELLPAFSARFHTETLAFGEGVRPVAPDALGAADRRSDLAAALNAVRERYRGRPIAGIVLLSDGGDTGNAVAETGESRIPVFPIAVGARASGRDREVLSVTAAEAVLDDSRVDVAASAVSHGHGTSPIELRLLENGRLVEVKRLAPAADGAPVTAVFHVAPARGAGTVYTVEIPPGIDELVPENNRRSVLVQPRSRSRRVLLVQGAPGFEHSFLQRALSGDRGLDLDSVVRKGKNDQGSDTFYVQAAAGRAEALAAGYPRTREALFAYDAIILANVEGALLTSGQLEATREFVARRGGGLLVLGAHSFLPRGLADTPLEPLLPLQLNERGSGVLPASAASARDANRVVLTPAGEAHPVMQLSSTIEETRARWDAVPAFASTAPVGGPRPGATVLAVTGAAGKSRALLAVQRYGEGRTMAFTGEAAWRWRMMLPASDRTYDTFWRQAVRWLAVSASDPVSVRVPAGSAPGDVLAIAVTARTPDFQPMPDAQVDVRVTRPDGRLEPVPAAVDPSHEDGGTFGANYRAEEPGIYRVTADVRAADGRTVSATSTVLVGAADAEMTDPWLNVQVLERIAAASGGRMIRPADAAQLADALRAALPAAAAAGPGRELWHNAWALGAVVALLAGEWIARRRWGLR